MLVTSNCKQPQRALLQPFEEVPSSHSYPITQGRLMISSAKEGVWKYFIFNSDLRVEAFPLNGRCVWILCREAGTQLISYVIGRAAGVSDPPVPPADYLNVPAEQWRPSP